MAGKTSIVVSQLYGRYVHLPLHVVTRRRKRLNLDSQCWQAVLESTGQHHIFAAEHPQSPAQGSLR
jgi:6-phosphofructokinase 1